MNSRGSRATGPVLCAGSKETSHLLSDGGQGGGGRYQGWDKVGGKGAGGGGG